MGTFFFHFALFFFFVSRFHHFLTKKKKKKKEKKDFAAARLATISATRYTGNRLFFKDGPEPTPHSHTLLVIDRFAPQHISPKHQNNLPALPIQTVISTFQGTGTGAPMGLLTEGPQCCMLISKNGHAPCHYFCNSHIDLKIVICTMLILRDALCCATYFFSQVARLHVACEL